MAADVAGRIELDEAMRDAISDLDSWSHLWVIYLFHERGDWSPKVTPPRSKKKRGVLATRSPHRPNPIGLSVVRLVRIEGLTLHIEGVDMLDGSPVLDIKPYVPYADAISGANDGWLREDPIEEWRVEVSAEAKTAFDWLRARGVDLETQATKALSLGPTPHAYRLIKDDVLAIKDWRIRFKYKDRTITITEVFSSWRRAQAESDPALSVHLVFLNR
jgi:tRNA (adenine37-N6)-methyltransferase